jgi:fluoride exporter
MIWIAVAAGGALGSLARHGVNAVLSRRFDSATPHATFIVNVIGCLVIGLLAGRLADGRLHMSPAMRTFTFVGVLGGFTTFSTLGLDTFTLAHGGDYAHAFWNLAGQVVLGLGAVWLGFAIA